MQSPEPLFLVAGRGVATEISPVNLEIQQLQPVLEAQDGNIVTVERKGVWTFRQFLTHSPQRYRIESGYHQLPVGNEDALDFPQNLMRIVAKLEHVRHHDQIDAVCREWQLPEIAKHVDLPRVSRDLAQGNPVMSQKGYLRQAKLQSVVAEEIVHHTVYFVLFPGHDIAPLRGGQPVIYPGY